MSSSTKPYRSKETNIKRNSVKLCCGGKSCPTLTQIEDKVMITDDAGWSCTITMEQALVFSKFAKELQKRRKRFGT